MSSKTFDVIVISRLQLKAPNLGVSKAYEQMISSLNSLGLSICLIAEGEQLTRERVSPLLSIISVPTSKGKLAAIWKMGIPHPVASWLIEIQEYLQLGRIVIAPIVGMQSSIFKTSKLSGQLYVSTLHTPYSQKTFLGNIYFRIQKKSLELTDINIANSTTVVNKLGINWTNKIAVIPHSIGMGSKVLNESAVNRKSPIWIGALSYRKGIDRLIALILLSRGEIRIKVVWSKSKIDFPWRVLLKILAKLGLCELFNQISEEELKLMIRKSSCLISTSRFESFGLTLIEAAEIGIGIIGINAPGVTETLPEISGGAVYFDSIRKTSSYLMTHNCEDDLVILGKKAAIYVENQYGFTVVSKLWEKTLLRRSISI